MEFKEGEYDYRESLLPPKEQRELNELRGLLFKGPLNDAQRERLIELGDKEEKRRTGKPGLIKEEEQQYLELTRKQTRSRGWTPQDQKKVRELGDRR